MLLYSFFTLIGAVTLYSFKDWRRGIYLMIFIGIIKDPIRKMIPDAPAYLALATVPVYVSILIGAFIENPKVFKDFMAKFPRLSKAIFIFVISLIPAAVKSATFGSGTWKVTALGLFSYMSVILGIYIGYFCFQRHKNMTNMLKFYCFITALLLIGTPMEYLGAAKGWAALGTTAMGNEWHQYSVPGVVINMIAGFYRSPDVMGWHSTALSMLSIVLATNTTGKERYFWVALAGWGLIGSVLCGRRKMFFMLPIFISVLTMVYFSVPKRIKIASVAMIVLISLFSGYYLYRKIGPNAAIEKYYFQNPDVIFGRVEKQGIDSVIGTYKQSGIFGEGLGTATQGSQHIHVSKPRTWQEGGLDRIMVEMGLPGFVCFIYLVLCLFMTIWAKIVNNPVFYNQSDFSIRAGLFSFMVANSACFVISHQIFGDPLIICFVAILIGALMSESYVEDQTMANQIYKLEKQSQHFETVNQFSLKKNNRQLIKGLLKT